MDFGQLQLNDKQINLYGAPGQRRFDFMVPILSVGADGVLVMIDNGAKAPLEELDYYLKTHHSFFQKKPAVIVITHYDDNNTETTLLDYHCYVKNHGFSTPVITIDARQKKQVIQALEKLESTLTHPKTAHGAMPAEAMQLAFS